MDKQAEDWTVPNWSRNPAVYGATALGALALGSGGRLTKNLWDILTSDEQKRGPVKLPKRTKQVAQIPVEVSLEEAEELERQGVPVRVRKEAADGDQVNVYKDPDISYLGAGALGALGTTAAIGGWKLTDWVIDKMRQRSAKQELQRTRDRLSRLLDDDPDEQDSAIYGSMKAAEDAYFEGHQKVADVGLGTVLAALATVAGGGLALNVLHGISTGGRKNQATERAKRISEYMRSRRPQQPDVEMVPVVRIRNEPDPQPEDLVMEEAKVEVARESQEPKKPGATTSSPARQAATAPPQPPAGEGWF